MLFMTEPLRDCLLAGRSWVSSSAAKYLSIANANSEVEKQLHSKMCDLPCFSPCTAIGAVLTVLRTGTILAFFAALGAESNSCFSLS